MRQMCPNHAPCIPSHLSHRIPNESEAAARRWGESPVHPTSGQWLNKPHREPKLSLGDMPWQTNHGFPSNQTRLFGGTGLRLVFPQADGEGDTEGAWHTVGDIKS